VRVLFAAVLLLGACSRDIEPSSPLQELRRAVEATVAEENMEVTVGFGGEVAWRVSIENSSRRSGIYDLGSDEMAVVQAGGQTFVSLIDPPGAYCSEAAGEEMLPDPLRWVDRFTSDVTAVRRERGVVIFTATIPGFEGPVGGRVQIANGLLESLQLRPSVQGGDAAAATLEMAFTKYGAVDSVRVPPLTAVLAPTSSACTNLNEVLAVVFPPGDAPPW
jgi:hypothetical protein